MLDSVGVSHTLRGKVLCRHGNNGFFNGIHPEVGMIASMFRVGFQIFWHNKGCAACEVDCVP